MKTQLIFSIALAVLIFCISCSPGLQQYQHLKEPKISLKPSQKMLITETSGTASEASKKGNQFTLQKRISSLNLKGKKMTAPRARWKLPDGIPTEKWLEVPQEKWKSIWGLPVSDEVTAIPADLKSESPITIGIWEYGDVAEILHIGPYDAEKPAIDRLHQFIKDNGYIIAGDHEEEYLKGPGILFSNPKNYQTIIRYPVKKANGE